MTRLLGETVPVSLNGNEVVELVSHLELKEGSAGEILLQVREANARYINWCFKSVQSPPNLGDEGHILLEGNSIAVQPRAFNNGQVVIGLYVWSQYPATLMVTGT